MVTGVTSTPTASNLSASSIRFPTLQSSGGNITMTTTVKSPKRMRSPITIRTSGNQPNQVGILVRKKNEEVSVFKGFGYFWYNTKHKHPQTYIKLTRLIDNDGRKLSFKIMLAELL